MGIPYSGCPLKFISQYIRETQLKAFFLNVVIITKEPIICHIFEKVYPLSGTVFAENSPPGLYPLVGH